MAYLKRHRADGNQGAIVNALRKAGWFVHITSSAGHGFPDLVAARGGRLELIEVKTPRGGTKEAQVAFHQAMKAKGVEVRVIRTAEEAARL